MITRTRLSLAVVASAALALSACSLTGGDQADQPATPSVAVSTPKAPSSDPTGQVSSSEPTSDDSSSDDASSDDSSSDDASSDEPSDEASSAAPTGDPNFKQTAPGTKLKFGQEAQVTHGSTTRKGNIIIKPTKVTKGSFADIAKIKGSEKYKDYTPHYVSITVTAGDDSAAALKYTGPNVAMKPFTPDLKGLGTVNVIGKFDKCETENFDKDPKKGESFETCIIVMAKTGEKVGGIAYAPAASDYSSVNGKPILWVQS